MNKINTAPESPADLALTPEVGALAELVVQGSPAWAWQVLAVDLVGPVASTRAPRHQQAGDVDQLAQLVEHLGAVSGSTEAVQADLFAEGWNERRALEHGEMAPMFRPSGVLPGVPRASLASTLIGPDVLTQDGRVWALDTLVGHLASSGADVPLEAVSVLAAWLVGPIRARRTPGLRRSFRTDDGEVNSGNVQAAEVHRDTAVSELVARLVQR